MPYGLAAAARSLSMPFLISVALTWRGELGSLVRFSSETSSHPAGTRYLPGSTGGGMSVAGRAGAVAAFGMFGCRGGAGMVV